MLLIDSGNSAIKTRLIDGDRHDDRVFSLRHGFGASGLADYLASLEVAEVYIASVASADAQRTLHELLGRHLPGVATRVLETLPELDGIRNAYSTFRNLGVDRWLTLLAARELTTGDAIIIDAGSAITIDLLSRQQGHLGGAILPGFNTTRERFVGLFPRVDYASPAVARTDRPGRDTPECINLDKVPVAPEDIRAIVLRWQALLAPPVEILLAGQDAGAIASTLTQPHRIVPDLVFIGMLKQIRCLG